jgi:hypothetical protein
MQIGEKGARFVAENLPALKKLNVSTNNMGDAGAEHLA